MAGNSETAQPPVGFGGPGGTGRGKHALRAGGQVRTDACDWPVSGQAGTSDFFYFSPGSIWKFYDYKGQMEVSVGHWKALAA